MSVDLFVSVSVDNWPSIEQVQQCALAQGYPLIIERFPVLDLEATVTDGAMTQLSNGAQAYLDGSLYPAHLWPSDVSDLNSRLRSVSDLVIGEGDAVMSIHTRSIEELRAASYLVASIIVCFDGIGIETQGNAGGKTEFAEVLISGANQLESLSDQ